MSPTKRVAEPQYPASARGRRAPGLLTLAAIGAASSAGTVIFPQNNSANAVFFAVVHASVLAPIVVGVASVLVGLVDGLLRTSLLARWRSWTMPSVICAVMVGGFVGWRYYILTDSIAFHRAFGMSVPAEIRNVTVEGSYYRWGDLAIFIEFEADSRMLRRIVSKRDFRRQELNEESWSSGTDWDEINRSRSIVWRGSFGAFAVFQREPWDTVPPTDNIQIYSWSGARHSEYTTLFWDADERRAYALYTFG